MADGTNKEVRVSLGVNEQSFDKGIRKVKELISELNKLSEATNKFGGGAGGLRIGNIGAKAGAGGGGTIATHQVGSSGADALANAVGKTSDAMKERAKAGVAALKDLDKVFQGFVLGSGGGIRRFVEQVGALGRAFQNLKSDANQAAAAAGAVGGMRGPTGTLVNWGGAAGPQPGLLQRMGNALTSPIAGTPNLPTSKLGVGWQVAGGIGAGVGLGMGALMLGSRFMGMRQESQLQNMDYYRQQQFFNYDKRAELGQMFGGQALRMKSGDYAMVLAQQRAMERPEFAKLMGNKMELNRYNTMRLKNPTSIDDDPTLTGVIKRAVESVAVMGTGGGAVGGGARMTSFGVPISHPAHLNKAGVPVSSTGGDERNLTQSELKQKVAEQDLIIKGPRDLNEAVLKEYDSDPVKNEYINRKLGGALGHLSLARQARISGKIVNVRNKDGTVTPMDSIDLFRARARKSMFDEGELAGMSSQMASAGYGLGTGGAESLLSMQHGGLRNALSLYGVGAQFGQGGNAKGAGAFMSSLQGLIGGKGLDVTAGASVFETGAQMMQGGDFMGSNGAGLMATMAGAAFRGTPGGDMLGARQANMGVAGMADTLSGSIDNLQKGLNASAALQSAGGLPYQSQSALMDLKPAMLMDIMKSGHVPAAIRAQFPSKMDEGEVLDVITKYADQVDKTSLAAYSSKAGEGTATGAAVAEFKKGGIRGYLSDPKMSRADKIKKLEILAPAFGTVRGKSYDKAMGELTENAEMRGLLGPGPKGSGAHQTVSKDSVYGDAAVAAAEKALEEARAGGANTKEERYAAANLNKAIAAAEANRKASQRFGTGGDALQAVDMVKNALDAFVNAIMRVSTESGTPQAPVKKQIKASAPKPHKHK